MSQEAAGEAQVPAGTISGFVTTSSDIPLPGADIFIYGTTEGGDRIRFSLTTDDQGRYLQEVPPGLYGVRAEYEHTIDREIYAYSLEPADGIVGRHHNPVTGTRKDFVWRISGPRPNQIEGVADSHTEPRKYYGGSLLVTFSPAVFGAEGSAPRDSLLILTLQPTRELLNGSVGETLTFSRPIDGQDLSSSYWYPANIPLGFYDLSAHLVTGNGTETPLQVKLSGDFTARFDRTMSLAIVPDGSGNVLPLPIVVGS